MTNAGFFKAALLGLAVFFSSFVTELQAENLQVVRKGASRDLVVTMNRAVVVESDVPFAELSIANPAIADFSTLSDRTIYVLGKAPGRTTLTLLDETGKLITNVEIHVSTDISEFKERIQQILPNERIEVRTANDGIVLSGSVSSTARMERALALAERYAPERVSNLMVVSGISRSCSRCVSPKCSAASPNSCPLRWLSTRLAQAAAARHSAAATCPPPGPRRVASLRATTPVRRSSALTWGRWKSAS